MIRAALRALLNGVRLVWLQHEVERIDARIAEEQAAVDAWPLHRGVWLAERSRLEGLRDRIRGRGDRVNYAFTRGARQ